MAMPFSNTTLRVPCGFGNILEGLAREVLRDQPEDIPAFAAQYFTALLRKRDESGLDPAKWSALMEHRVSNDDAFKDTANQENFSPDTETRSSMNEVWQADSHEMNANNTTQPTENSSPSPETPDASEDIFEPESQPNNELNESEETDSELNEEMSYRGAADVDICAEELNKMEALEEQIRESAQEPDSGDGENETAEKEPVTLSSYGGLADIDVCAEELQPALQEHSEGNEDMTAYDAGFIPPSQSPDPVLAKQDVLDTHDEPIPSGTETLTYLDQDVNKVLSDISYSEQTIASSVKEDEIGDTGHLPEDVRDMTNALFDDAGPEIHNAGRLHLNKEAESVSVSDEVKTFDETNTDEIPVGLENQQENDILAAEAMSESLLILEKDNLVNRSSKAQPGLRDLEKASEVLDGEHVTDVNTGSDEKYYQTDMKQDEPINDDPQDIFETTPEEEKEGLVNKDDIRTYGDEVQDTGESDKENNTLNAPQTQVDNLFYSPVTHEAKGTLPVPISEETDQDIEVTYKQSDLEEHTEEPETASDEESQHQEGMLHETLPESENKEVEQQEESSQPQEEEDIMDIPLDDPEANKAAAKIQAGFRGHMTRKKLKPGDKPGEEVSSTGETLNGSQGDAAGGPEGVETDETSVPEQ